MTRFKESSSALCIRRTATIRMDCNEYVRSTADFYFALEKRRI
jgi:hypothetical protein